MGDGESALGTGSGEVAPVPQEAGRYVRSAVASASPPAPVTRPEWAARVVSEAGRDGGG